MADQRFRALSSCLVIALLVMIVTAQNNGPEKDIHVNNFTQLNNYSKMTNETRSSTCVPAYPSPLSRDVCKPYVYGEKGVCSSIIGKRLIYGSLSNQESMEELLDSFITVALHLVFKDDNSHKCVQTVELVYCNHYFKRCDNASSIILPVPVCREACEVMFQQHCKEEYRRAHEINKAVKGSEAATNQWSFDLINCTTLPRRNGGTIPECYYPRELEENINREDLSDACSYGNGQSYRGNISVTQSGYRCQSWTSQCPHRHHRTPDNFPEVKNAGNACRNPGGQAPHGPWCYTTNVSVRWEYCNISICPPGSVEKEPKGTVEKEPREFVCEVVADVAFLVDSSGSMGWRNWGKMLQFLKDMVKAFNVGPDKTHIAAVSYSNEAVLEFKFDTLKGIQVTEAGYYSLIDKIGFQRGFTYIDKALILADQQVFQRWAGMRAQLRQIAIVITDGRQTVHRGPYTPLVAASSGLKLKKVQVYSLGIGSNVDRKQLEDIASSKDKVFFATSFAELAPLAQTIVQNSCPGTVEKEPTGFKLMGITIVSAVGSVIFIVLAALAAILFKKHRAGRKPNIPDDAAEEEITPYATVRFSSIFPLNAENNGPGDIPLRTLPFQLRTPPEERATGGTDLRNSPYENTDHLGRSSVNPLEYLYYQPRYENEVVDSETRGVVIRPGYDKLVHATRKKRRENGGAHLGRRLPCGMVDTHCLSVYDSLVRETDLRCKSRRGDITDSESEDEHSPV